MIIQDDLAVTNIVSADEKKFIATRRNGTSFYFSNPANDRIKTLERKIEQIIPSIDNFVDIVDNDNDNKNNTDQNSSNIITMQNANFTQTTNAITENNNFSYNGAFMKVQTSQHTGIWARFWENTKNTNGDGIGIGAGGLTILGSGESPFNYYKYLLKTYNGSVETVEELEHTYVTSDNNVYIVPNCQNGLGTSSDKHIEYLFNNNGFYMQNKPIRNIASLEMSPSATTSNNGGVINFHYNQSSTVTSKIAESASGAITITGEDATTKIASSVSKGLTVKATNLSRDEVCTTQTDGGGHYITDTNGSLMARVFHRHKTNGNNVLRLETTRTVDGTAKYAGIEVGLTSAGDAVYSVTTPANFRDALGATNGVWPTSMIPTLNQNTTGNAATATKLATAREIYVALGSTRNTDSPVTFDGSAAKAIHVSGTLPIARGGTGATTAANARTNLGITRENLPTKSTWKLLYNSTDGVGAGYNCTASSDINFGDYGVFKILLKGTFVYADKQQTQEGCCLAVKESSSIYGTGGWDDSSGTFTLDVFLKTTDSANVVKVQGASCHRITTSEITSSARPLKVYKIYGLI